MNMKISVLCMKVKCFEFVDTHLSVLCIGVKCMTVSALTLY